MKMETSNRFGAAALPAAFLSLALIFSACSEDGPSAPAAPGGVTASIATTGVDLDPDGFTVVVDEDHRAEIPVNGSATIPGVPAGTFQVELTGLAANCTVQGDNPRGVTIPSGGTTTVSFQVTCGHLLSGTIAFNTDRDGNDEIYSMRADGTGLIRLTNHGAQDDWPHWPLGESRIFFVSSRDDVNGDVFVMDPSGSGVTNLTTPNPNGSDVDPAFTPVFGLLAFSTFRGPDCPDIGLLDLAIGGVEGFAWASNEPFCGSRQPSWTPDGQAMVVSRGSVNFETLDHDIWILRSDQTRTRLTDHPAHDSQPKVSPDGTRIALVSTRDGNGEIYVMDLDGSNLRRLTNDPALDFQPEWSPDGSKIVFTSDRGGQPNLYVMTADGREQVALNTGEGNATVPTWSPASQAASRVSIRFSAAQVWPTPSDEDRANWGS